MDMTGTMLLQQAAEDWAKEHYKSLSPYQAAIFGFIGGYTKRCDELKAVQEPKIDVTIRTLSSWQIERLKELLMTSEVIQIGIVDESGVLVVEYDSRPFDVNAKFKTVQINRFP